jgi:malonate transporter
MLATLSVVIPIFGLVLAGFLCRRAGVLGETATTELNRFVVWLGLPALFFDVTSSANWDDLYHPGYTAVLLIASLLVFFCIMPFRVRTRGLASGSIEALNGSYPNSGYMGYPLGLLVFGPESYPLVTISAIITVCIFFGLALVFVEIGIREDRRFWPMFRTVALSLLKNPLFVAPVLGVAYAASGLPMPSGPAAFLDLLGGAASPCALVALGTFMADNRNTEKAETSGLALLTAAKLFAVPFVAFILAYFVFDLPKATADLAILLAALPTGTGPFMLAQYYGHAAAITARTILYSTLGSVVTISALIYLLGYGG